MSNPLPQIICSEDVGKRLRTLRTNLGMKNEAFCKKMGISKSQWDCVLNQKSMGVAIYERMAKNLDIDFYWMMYGTVDVKSQTELKLTAKETKHYRFVPKKNITTYELARAVPLLLIISNGYDCEVMINSLPPEVKRHFEEVK